MWKLPNQFNEWQIEPKTNVQQVLCTHLADGTSTLPCSDTYGGSSAGSEPETQIIQTTAYQLAPELLAWVSIHAAANMWLHPYGNTKDGACERSVDHDHQVCLIIGYLKQHTGLFGEWCSEIVLQLYKNNSEIRLR